MGASTLYSILAISVLTLSQYLLTLQYLLYSIDDAAGKFEAYRIF